MAIKIDTNNIFTLIDAVGEDGSDPGSGWTVSGVSNGTKDRTLIRFSNICKVRERWTLSLNCFRTVAASKKILYISLSSQINVIFSNTGLA